MCKTTTVIAKTNKGARVFLQGLTAKGYEGRYAVTYYEGAIKVEFHDTGKRKITASKGGVIDLESKKVLAWAKGSETAYIEYHSHAIFISREV